MVIIGAFGIWVGFLLSYFLPLKHQLPARSIAISAGISQSDDLFRRITTSKNEFEHVHVKRKDILPIDVFISVPPLLVLLNFRFLFRH